MAAAATRIKFCGITRLEDANAAAEAGAWAIGFILWSGSPRYVDPAEAAAIARQFRRKVRIAGVFVDQPLDEVVRLTQQVGLDLVQLHGNEGPSYCSEVHHRTGAQVMKAARVQTLGDVSALQSYRIDVDFHLLDAFVEGEPGGTGTTFDHELARAHQRRIPLILSGGLTPENVGEAITKVAPFAVDVSSGVEIEPGIKDPEKIAAFAAAVAAVTFPDDEPADAPGAQPEPAAASTTDPQAQSIDVEGDVDRTDATADEQPEAEEQLAGQLSFDVAGGEDVDPEREALLDDADPLEESDESGWTVLGSADAELVVEGDDAERGDWQARRPSEPRAGRFEESRGGYRAPRGGQGGPRGGGFRDRDDRGPRGGGYRGDRDDRGPRGGGFRDRDDRGPRGGGGFRDRDDRGPRGGGYRGDRDDRGPRGGGFRDRDDRGPRGGGFRDDRGPRGGGFRNDRGPRPGGGGFRDRDDRGPRGGGFRDDRGPRPGGGGFRDRDDRGPRGGGFRDRDDRGPRGGGYRDRDDRGPRGGGYRDRDDRGPRGGGFRDDRGPRPGGGGFRDRDDRGPRGGAGFRDRDDRGPRGGGYRGDRDDRGPRGGGFRDDRGPRGGGFRDRDDRGPRGGGYRGDRDDRGPRGGGGFRDRDDRGPRGGGFRDRDDRGPRGGKPSFRDGGPRPKPKSGPGRPRPYDDRGRRQDDDRER